MAYENYANPSPPTSLIQTTLNGAIVAGTTTLTVVSTAGFPATGSFHVIIDSEIVLCSVASGTTLSATDGTAGRGREGTSAASHASGAPVILSLTAESLRFLMGGIRIVSGTSDTLAATDARALVVYTNSSAVAVTLPQAGTAGFDDHFCVAVQAFGANGITITPTACNIDGTSSLALVWGESAIIYCSGTDYITIGTGGVSKINSGRVAGRTSVGFGHWEGIAVGQGLVMSGSSLIVDFATQAEMEAGTEANAAVSPSVVQYHPSAAKAWINFDGTSGSIGTGRASYNMDAVTDNGTGDYTINLTTDFSSANYAILVSGGVTAAGALRTTVGPSAAVPTAGTCRVTTYGSGGGAGDLNYVSAAFFGDQ